ncbi:MAG: hypothetical protein GF411_18100 [Candidatus Lokiarchaeota archaeon]|nr:hypothetical protein [Candidatus Lokiarchaeota archaeon]
MTASRTAIKEKILLILDRMPCHGYDLLDSLNGYHRNLRLTTLYRWLHEMESEGLIISSMEPGLTGPKRRVYHLGPRGESKLREILRSAIEVLLHFFSAYRGFLTEDIQDNFEKEIQASSSGRILLVANPRLNEPIINIIRYLLTKCSNKSIDAMGDVGLLRVYEIDYRQVEGVAHDMPVSSNRYSEIWLSGTSDAKMLPIIIAECKRALKPGGVLRIIAPFVFFDEPTEPTLSEFIRVTSVQLFPDLGIVEGTELSSIINEQFQDYGISEVFPGLVLFWAVKNKM